MARKQTSTGYEKDGYVLGRRGKSYVADNRAVSGGKRSTLGKFRTEAEAIEALHRFIEARKALQRQQASHTIGILWQMWMAYRERNGFKNNIYMANWASLCPFFAHKQPTLLTEDECMDYAEQRFAAKCSSWTVNTELARLRACLAWAAERRHIEYAPVVWVPSRGKPRTKTINADEARALLVASYEDLHVYVFNVLALTTAARHMAILDLEWDRVDFAGAGLIDYEVYIEFNPMHKTWTKGRAQVPMNVLVRAALMRAYAVRQTDHVVEYRGKRLKTIRASFALAVGRAGLGKVVPAPTKAKPKQVKVITNITPHTLRHSVNTWLQERGIDAERRAEFLGQRDVRTNQLVYSHGSAVRMLTAASDAIDAEIGPCPTTSKRLDGTPLEGFGPVEIITSCPLVPKQSAGGDSH